VHKHMHEKKKETLVIYMHNTARAHACMHACASMQ